MVCDLITLDGTARYPGVAIAVAAVVDAKLGINGVSPALLQEGISALRNGLRAQDYPEAVMACDNVALGGVMRVPGVNTVAIAAESDCDPPGLPIEIPCVLGVADLLKSISEGDIVIVDGYKGVVHIDPDPGTLVHYQQAEEHRHIREKVFIASEHIPARTANGEIVFVYANLRDESELDAALDSGADGLVYDLRGDREDPSALCGHVLREAAGKPVVFIVEMGCEEILRAVMVYCTPGQVTLVSESADLLVSQVETALDTIVLEALQLDVEPPEVNMGWIAPVGDAADCSPLVIDASEWVDGFELPESEVEPVVIARGEADAIETLVAAGVRRVAVEPASVGAVKYAVRSIGVEDEA